MINLIKVDATASTNSLLKAFVRSKTVTTPSCIWAKTQTEGRGQMGNQWKAESGLNLTFSIYTPISKELSKHNIAINLLSALSIYTTLETLNLPQLYIKWPNDIMSANKKIGGILIENLYQNGVYSGSIVGVGLNVNQISFKNLPLASSLKKITSNTFELKSLLENILNNFDQALVSYQSTNFKLLKLEYETCLFRKGKASTFIKNKDSSPFTGVIQGITDEGKLIVLEEDQITNHYNLKDIKLLF